MRTFHGYGPRPATTVMSDLYNFLQGNFLNPWPYDAMIFPRAALVNECFGTIGLSISVPLFFPASRMHLCIAFDMFSRRSHLHMRPAHFAILAASPQLCTVAHHFHSFLPFRLTRVFRGTTLWKVPPCSVALLTVQGKRVAL